MQALFRVLMLVVLVTGLALSTAWARDQQFSPPLPPDLTPEWASIPGAPECSTPPIPIPTCSAWAEVLLPA